MSSASLADDLFVSSHRSTVHYAPKERKCLLHSANHYAAGMETSNDRLRKAREDYGLKTVEAGAAFLGVNPDTYRQHENGTGGRGVPRDRAIHYARRYKVSLEWLLTGKGEQKLPDVIPETAVLEAMIGDALNDSVTMQTKIADIPQLVAQTLRSNLEEFQADPKIAAFWRARPARAARTSGSTKTGGKAG